MSTPTVKHQVAHAIAKRPHVHNSLKWLHHHRGWFIGLGVLIVVASLTVLTLALLGVGPFAKYKPISNANKDPRVILGLINDKRKEANLPPLTEVPKMAYDPNGFHGLWAAPSKSTAPAVIEAQICQPCWSIDDGATTLPEVYNGSFEMGYQTADPSVLQKLYDAQKGAGAYCQLNTNPNDLTQAQELAWKYLCLGEGSETCAGNFIKEVGSSGTYEGVGWGTNGEYNSPATYITDMSPGGSLIKTVCPSGPGASQKQNLTNYIDAAGTTIKNVPVINGASQFMQDAFNQCYASAVTGVKEATGTNKSGASVTYAAVPPVAKPIALCTNIVLSTAASASNIPKTNKGDSTTAEWYADWKHAEQDVVMERAKIAAGHTKCPYEFSETPESGCCPIPTPRIDGVPIQAAGGCVRVCYNKDTSKTPLPCST